MRLGLVTVVAAAAAAIAAAPVSAGSDVVVVAGYGQIAGGASARVVAVSTPAGVHGRLDVQSQPGFRFVSKVTCVRVVGDRVLVGGVIVRATNPATIGNTSLVGVEDDAAGDRVGLAFSNSGLDSCPVFDLPLHELTRGGFVVIA